jgi:hypothetical protein
MTYHVDIAGTYDQLRNDAMPTRIIKSASRTSSYELLQAISSVFVLELLAPGDKLYLISPWISDVPLLQNAFGQLRAIIPEFEGREVRLSVILNLLAQRGTVVRILTRNEVDNPGTQDFERKLVPEISVRYLPTIHEKGLITRHSYIGGSMNFTFSGVYINHESVTVCSDIERVSAELIEANSLWEQVDG